MLKFFAILYYAKWIRNWPKKKKASEILFIISEISPTTEFTSSLEMKFIWNMLTAVGVEMLLLSML